MCKSLESPLISACFASKEPDFLVILVVLSNSSMNYWSKNVALHITYNLKQPANKNTQFISTLLVESVKNAKN